MSARVLLLASLHLISAAVAAKPKHLIFMLADDLVCTIHRCPQHRCHVINTRHLCLTLKVSPHQGWYDTSVYGDQSPETRQATHNLTALADAGIRLSHHYVHWHCSPSRRSFITGRSPLHHGEQLSAVNGDDIDLRWTWISEKLEAQGYVSHWYGKGHTGYESMQHMPATRGFNGGSVLYLGGTRTIH